MTEDGRARALRPPAEGMLRTTAPRQAGTGGRAQARRQVGKDLLPTEVSKCGDENQGDVTEKSYFQEKTLSCDWKRAETQRR